MNNIESHIAQYLHSFLKTKSNEFDLIFETIKDENKSRCKDFLIYLDNLLSELLNSSGNKDLKFSHIHIPISFQYHYVILEFIVLKLFINAASNQIEKGRKDYYISHITSILDKELVKPIRLSSTAGKREHTQKREAKKKLRKLNKDLKKLQELGYDSSKENYLPKWLMHLLVRDYNFLVSQHSPSAFFCGLNDLIGEGSCPVKSYVLINNDKSLNDLDDVIIQEKSVLEHIENILLFDCVSRKSNQQFNYSNLCRFNNEGLNLKNLVIISFEVRPFGLNRIISKLTDISTRYFERSSGLNFQTYLMYPFEVDTLTNDISLKQLEVTLVECDNLFWNNFQDLIYDHENLYELLSIKMRNIYSLSFDELYKKLIIDDIFLPDHEPLFITKETKSELFRLEENERLNIREAIENVLGIIAQLNIPSQVEGLQSADKIDLVIPYQVFNSQDFISLLKKKFSNCNFITWKEITDANKKEIIILDYRDQGRFPYSIYPNLLEHRVPLDQHAKGLFLSMFFKKNYDYAIFEYNKVLFERLGGHNIRNAKFGWNDLTQFIRYGKPKYKLDTYLWDLDNSYNGTGERESVSIKLISGNRKSFYPSQLFIAKTEGEEHYFPVRADEIGEYRKEYIIYIQPLDELYEDINLFETSEEEEKEISLLKQHYDLTGEEQEHRLWKILIKRKCDLLGVKEVYKQLEDRLSLNETPMVRKSYFEDNWVNIKSDSLIPRSKRTFKILCDFLELPEVYFRVMLKKRANERMASRSSTSKMNHLIAGLMEKGMFDDTPRDLTFDEAFINKYDLHELWFNVENLSTELQSLVDLLKPNIELTEVVNTEHKSI